jgi:hypothetical protein
MGTFVSVVIFVLSMVLLLAFSATAHPVHEHEHVHEHDIQNGSRARARARARKRGGGNEMHSMICRFIWQMHFLLFLEALASLAWARVALRLTPERVLRGVMRESGKGGQADAQVLDAFTAAAGKAPFSHNCMHRALALRSMLARRGVDARLCIGLGAKPELLPGHAWLQINGVIVGDAPELVSRYQTLRLTEAGLALAFRK